ncbi:hypothetical protein PG999_006609 [Apiospora kogelbergensis]|uniref:Uncharacterized protein n=1 Tax=Apiospora kogelbergensis TaxID=1337665 RepID=A0AAW0QVZ4_9PEZI
MEEKALSAYLNAVGSRFWFVGWHDARMGIVTSWQPKSSSTTRPAASYSPHHPEPSIGTLEWAWRMPYNGYTPLQPAPPGETPWEAHEL